VKDVRVKVGFWAKNALATRCQILDARIFERKTKVAGLEKCLKVVKLVKSLEKDIRSCGLAR